MSTCKAGRTVSEETHCPVWQDATSSLLRRGLSNSTKAQPRPNGLPGLPRVCDTSSRYAAEHTSNGNCCAGAATHTHMQGGPNCSQRNELSGVARCNIFIAKARPTQVHKSSAMSQWTSRATARVRHLVALCRKTNFKTAIVARGRLHTRTCKAGQTVAEEINC